MKNQRLFNVFHAKTDPQTAADDGKHASSVIEVDISPQGQEEREVWRERGRQAHWEGSRIGSNLSNFSNVFNSFLFIFFTSVLGVLFCAFWVQKRLQGRPFG